MPEVYRRQPNKMQPKAMADAPTAQMNAVALETSVATERRVPMMVAICSLMIIAALVVGVGLASTLVLRHVVQTLPLWLGIGFGARRSRLAGWIALPCFVFWLALMVVIWLFLLGIAQLVNGRFTPVEVGMTIVVGVSSVVGIAAVVRSRWAMPPGATIGLFVLGAALQLVCFRLSFLPWIAHR
jgi:hypothetical protein